MLDQVQLAEHAGDDWVADLGNALLDVLNGQTGQEQTWAFNLDTVVEEGHADGSSAMGVVGVDERVDDDFAQDVDGNAPKVFAANIGKIRPTHRVLFQEQDDFIDRFRQRIMDVDVVENVGLVIPDEAPALNPCVVEILATVAAVEQYAAMTWDQPSLILDQNSQALQRPLVHRFAAIEILTDGFEVERVQREARHGQGIETHSGHTALQLSDEVRVGLPVGGAKSNIDTVLHALRLEEMGARAAQEYLYHEQGFPFHRDHLDIRHQSRGDRIGDHIGQPLLFIQRVCNANDLPVIRHAQHQTSAGGIRKGDQGLEHRTRRRQVPLEFQRLTFRLLDQVFEHWCGNEGEVFGGSEAEAFTLLDFGDGRFSQGGEPFVDLLLG